MYSLRISLDINCVGLRTSIGFFAIFGQCFKVLNYNAGYLCCCSPACYAQ